MKKLPRDLNLHESLELLRFMRAPLGRRVLENLLDLRVLELRQELAENILDPEIPLEALVKLTDPYRAEILKIRYAREFLDSVESAALPDKTPGSA